MKNIILGGFILLRIFICEDNEEDRIQLEGAISEIIKSNNLNVKIDLSTENPEKIIEYLKMSHNNGIYFLDIDLKCKINGIKLAEEIRKYDPRGFIVFVTTHAEMSYLTFKYKLEVMDYIIKDDHEDLSKRIRECLKNADKKYSYKVNKQDKCFCLKVEDKIISVDYNKIVFFETAPKIHKVVLHGMDRIIEFYSNMKDVEKNLDNRFVRCHRSYIVNKDKIKKVDSSERIVYLNNGEKCSTSTRLIRKLEARA